MEREILVLVLAKNGKVWMHECVPAILHILHHCVFTLLQMLRDIISLHTFSGCWKWNKSMCVCFACVVLLCFLLSSLCVNLCHVAYGYAAQESCVCILTSVVGSVRQDWQHCSLVGQYGPQKEVFCGVEV